MLIQINKSEMSLVEKKYFSRKETEVEKNLEITKESCRALVTDAAKMALHDRRPFSIAVYHIKK